VKHENEVLVLVLHSQRSVKWCSGHIVPICPLHHNDTSLMLLRQLLSLNGSTSLARCANDVDPVSDQQLSSSTKPCSPWECSKHSPRRAGLRSWDTRGLGPAGPNPL